MTVRSEPLLRLTRQLGLDDEGVARVEQIDRLAGTFDVSSRAVSAMSVDFVRNFADAYSAAARLTIGTGDLVEFTVEDGQFDEHELRRLTEEASRVDATYRAVIAVHKERLVAELVEGAPDAVVRLFFFSDVLVRYLAHPPSDVQRELWADARKRLIVVLVDGSVHITGACLSIVPGERDVVAAEVAEGVPAGLDRIAARRNDYIGWDNALSTQLTPTHFERPDIPIGALGNRLDSLAVGLGAMYLCDRARDVDRPNGGSYTQVEFRGREHVAFVPINWDALSLSPATRRHVDAVLGVVAWCYEPIPEHPGTDMVADRLPFVQTRVAQLLESRPEQDRLDVFATVMPSIAEGVKWHWRSFIEGRVAEYLDHVRELESLVSQTVERLAEDTSSLVKRLTETSLAAVAALIGSIIAATFRDPFHADLFRIGMLAYAGYVLLFPFGIGLSSSVSDARLAFSAFEVQQGTLGEVLGDDRVRHIIAERPELARQRFRFWARLVGALYVVAIVAAAIAALMIPEIVEG